MISVVLNQVFGKYLLKLQSSVVSDCHCQFLCGTVNSLLTLAWHKRKVFGILQETRESKEWLLKPALLFHHGRTLLLKWTLHLKWTLFQGRKERKNTLNQKRKWDHQPKSSFWKHKLCAVISYRLVLGTTTLFGGAVLCTHTTAIVNNNNNNKEGPFYDCIDWWWCRKIYGSLSLDKPTNQKWCTSVFCHQWSIVFFECLLSLHP